MDANKTCQIHLFVMRLLVLLWLYGLLHVGLSRTVKHPRVWRPPYDLEQHKSHVRDDIKKPTTPLEDVEDISPLPHVFESDRLPITDGSVNLRYLPSVANGHLATNIYTDTIYVNGLYNGNGGRSHRARIPSLHASNFTVPDITDETRRYSLAVHRAVFEERINNSKVQMTYRTYAHYYFNRLLVTELTVERLPGVTGDIPIIREDFSGPDSDDIEFNNAVICGNETYNCRRMDGQIWDPETDWSGRTPIYVYYNDMEDIDFTLPSTSDTEHWTFLISLDQDSFVAEKHFSDGMALVQSGRSSDLLNIHTDLWTTAWDQGNIEMDGDLHLQKVVYGSLYYLYSNLPSTNTSTPTNEFFGLSPGGLANGAPWTDYYGHVFWDMETWMYPAMLMFRPDLAKAMLSYRIRGMDPAFERAADGGYNGTRFPWESAYTGVEVTPFICPECRENQQHITGDIAFAARQYLSATRDTQWLNSPQSSSGYTGFQFLHEMGRFWYTRPTWNETKERFDINGVMPPDEHATYINNSIFTNVVASLSVHLARYAACLAGVDHEDEVPDEWLEVAEKLFFPYHRTKRYHEEFEGYDYLLETNNSNPIGIKQADVVLLGFPLLWDMPADVRWNDLEHYESVTNENGPAMTWGMHSVGWLELGEPGRAADLFNRSYELYVRQPFKIWTEVKEGVGAVNFITGMGGFLQSLMFGYGGMRLRVEELDFHSPQLPPQLTRLKFNSLNYLGTQFDVEITSTIVTVYVRQDNSNEFPLQLRREGEDPWDMTTGSSLTFDPEPFTIATTTLSGCDLPCDCIEVDYGQVDPLPIPPLVVSGGSKLTAGSATLAVLNCLFGLLILSFC